MGKVYDGINDKLTHFMLAQHVFFVATAPRSPDAHLNVSPKGMAGTFAVFGPHRVGYLDYTGSGAETIAHLRESGRIIVMFCAFDGPPTVLRLHGQGRVVPAADPEFARLRPRFTKPREIGQRSIIMVDVDRVSDSCGYAVPLLDFRADRDILDRSHQRREAEPAYFDEYWHTRNAASIDGIPALGDTEPRVAP